MVSEQGAPSSLQPTSSNASGGWGKVRAIGSQVSDSTKMAFAQQRPWSELMDRNSFRRPESISDASSRMRKNLNYFRMNYVFFIMLAVGVSLLWHPVSLVLSIVLLAAWVFLYFSRTEPLVLFHRSFGDTEILAALGIATILIIFLTNVGSTLLSVLAIAAAIIAVHAVFRNPDDLFLDEYESASTGLSSNSGSSYSTRVPGP